MQVCKKVYICTVCTTSKGLTKHFCTIGLIKVQTYINKGRTVLVGFYLYILVYCNTLESTVEVDDSPMTILSTCNCGTNGGIDEAGPNEKL